MTISVVSGVFRSVRGAARYVHDAYLHLLTLKTHRRLPYGPTDVPVIKVRRKIRGSFTRIEFKS
jgi:hypothetical protein